MGIALASDARRKGYGGIALELGLRHALDVLNLRKILVEVRADNVAATALFKSAGFTNVGLLRTHYDDGQALYDVVLMELVKRT